MTYPKESKTLLTGSIAFSPVLCKVFGVCSGLLIQQIHYWCMDRQHLVDGSFWVWNTTKEWADQLGVFDERTIKNNLKGLRERGVVIVSNHNKHGYDRTLWYRLDYACLAVILQTHRVKVIPLHDPLGNCFTIHSDPVSLTIPETTTKTTAETSLAAPRKTEPLKLPLGEPLTIDIAETPMTKTPAPAKAILAAHQLRKNPSKAMNTSGSLQHVWRTTVPKHHDDVKFIPEFTLAEKGQFSAIVRNLGTSSDSVVEFVAREWVGYSKFVADAVGIKSTPSVPHIGFLLKYAGHAKNYMLQNPVTVKSTATKSVQLIAKPVVPKTKVNPFKTANVASVDDLQDWDKP